jgi:Zn-dependent peptidase ImmA (M78 family)/transcriptional regulator with XRE-family HTH domain
MKATEVPLTPTVLEWAIKESGYSVPEVARAIGIDESELGEWLRGKSNPKLTPFRKLAAVLHRPAAAFLLAEPPKADGVAVHFRRPANVDREGLNPIERRHIREARRVQSTTSWLLRELGEAASSLPRVQTSLALGLVATNARQVLGVTTEAQLGWADESKAQAAWREALESVGVSVLLLRLGENSCRGFSIWDDYAPVMGISSYFRPTARVFTMLHEFGHLLTRSSSACVEQGRGQRLMRATDPLERWCEGFAAAVLLPEGPVLEQVARRRARTVSKTLTLDDAGAIARRFKASLRATVIRLIELGEAGWELYREIPPVSDDKPRGGGGRGLNRAELREQEFGARLQRLFVRGMREDLISRGDVLSHLRISEDDLENLEEGARG